MLRQLPYVTLVGAWLILVLVCLDAFGAPGPKGDPEIVGQYEWGSLRSPTLTQWTGSERIVYWLIFADNVAAENQANKLEEGMRVKVRGRLAAGGGYKYIIVSQLQKDE